MTSTAVADYATRQNILDEITPSQWRRFQSYARRVRTLLKNALEPSVKKVDNIVWVLLGSHLSGQPLLPNLRELSLAELTPNYLASLVLLSPSLHALGLDFSHADYMDADIDRAPYESRPLARGILLQLLMPNCRRLSHLAIHYGLEDMPPRMLSSITGLDKLYELDLVYSEAIADFGTLQAISKMADLRDLTLRFSLDPPRSGEASCAWRRVLKALQASSIRRHPRPSRRIRSMRLCTTYRVNPHRLRGDDSARSPRWF